MPAKEMKSLYVLTQNDVRGYDTYDSVVVCAMNAEEARSIHPNQIPVDPWARTSYGCWARSPDRVSVEFIGMAKPGLPIGVVVASFNAG